MFTECKKAYYGLISLRRSSAASYPHLGVFRSRTSEVAQWNTPVPWQTQTIYLSIPLARSSRLTSPLIFVLSLSLAHSQLKVMIIYALINEQRATARHSEDNCLLICKMLTRKWNIWICFRLLIIIDGRKEIYFYGETLHVWHRNTFVAMLGK
jgi:hypothetical protein